MKRQPSGWQETVANETTGRGLVSPNIQAAHATEYQKNKQPDQKVGQRPGRTFLQ